MLREYARFIAYAIVMMIVGGGLLFVMMAYGPLSVVGIVAAVFALVIGGVMWKRLRTTRMLERG